MLRVVRAVQSGVFPSEATKLFLLNRIVSIRLRAVTRGPPCGLFAHPDTVND